MLQDIINNICPYTSLLSLLILCFFIYKSRNYWFAVFKEISCRQWLVLGLIFMVSLWFRFVFFKPRHIAYVDEFWYMEAAKNFISHWSIGMYPESMGWPIILAVVFFLFGISNLVAIYTSALFGSLTGINIFLLGSEVYKNRWLGLGAAAIFAMIPGHMLWSVTAKMNVVSIYFVTLSVFFSFLYYRHKKNLLLWTSLLCIGFSTQIRPENHLFFLLFLLGTFIFIRPLPKFNFKYFAPWLLTLFLLLPDTVRVLQHKMSSYWLAKESAGVIVGSNFSIQNFLYNSARWGSYLFSDKLHPFILTLLFMAGGIYCFRRHKKFGWFLFGWFILFYVLYFSAWFQTLGGGMQLSGKVRFYLSFYPVLVIFAIGGIYSFGNIIVRNKSLLRYRYILQILFLLILLFNFLFYIRGRRDPLKELEIKVISELDKFVSEKDIILINLTAVLNATKNFRLCELEEFLNNREIREIIFSLAERVLFLEDYTCTIPVSGFPENCEKIKEEYDIELCHEFSAEDYNLPTQDEDGPNIRLYQIITKRKNN